MLLQDKVFHVNLHYKQQLNIHYIYCCYYYYCYFYYCCSKEEDIQKLLDKQFCRSCSSRFKNLTDYSNPALSEGIDLLNAFVKCKYNATRH